MDGNNNGFLREMLEKIQASVQSLEKRVKILEDRLDISTGGTEGEAPLETATGSQIRVKKAQQDYESIIGGSQLGWLAIIISLIGAAFLLRFAFAQEWITGWRQPLMLALIGLILIAISDYLMHRQFVKFASALTICGYFILSMAFYVSSIHYRLTSFTLIIIGSSLIFALSMLWGLYRESSLWPICGLIFGGLLPLFALKSEFGGFYSLIYYNLIFIASVIFSVKHDWYKFPFYGTLTGHIALLLIIRHFFQNSDNSVLIITLFISTIPGMLIVWSGLVHTYARRKYKIFEFSAWIINNLLLYVGIKSAMSRINISYLLLIPVAANALLYFLSGKLMPGSKAKRAYLTGLVVSIVIGLTVLLPMPFDIIALCLFSVYLSFTGEIKQGWDYKGLAGAVIVYCLIFLFAFRFGFSTIDEMPFVNFRFISFAVASISFGYQGVIIMKDLSAGRLGTFLGQGLLSLGLLVLLAGMGGEIYHLFPPDRGMISQKALLGLTILGAIFSFLVTFAGLKLRLFYIRILALGLFIVLVSKMLILDLPGLKPAYFILSLAIVGLLLGWTSILIKSHQNRKKLKTDEKEN